MPAHLSPTRSRPRRRHRHRRGGAVALAAAVVAPAALLLAAGPASAHVVVHPDSTTPGSEAELTFRVPSETPGLSTVALTVTLPTQHPLAEVAVKPLPGWRITVRDAPLDPPVVDEGTTITTAPHTVTWTAVDKAAWIPPEEFQDFSVSGGPLPASGTLTFTARQTYSDGSVVTWDQPTVAGQPEPEHPAPSLTVGAAAHPPLPADSRAQAATPATPDRTARWLAGAALVVALGGLGLCAAQGLTRRGPR
jgi:uncharacterized protein YcnI